MDYANRIHKAIDYIEENLGENLTAQSVASEVGFSAFHFHRIFKALLGESITDYIRKRRLAGAARLLLSTSKPIIEIALATQFETQESFTRAFKKMFGTTPNAFRGNGKISPLLDKQVFSLELMEHIGKGVTMEPKFVERGEELVVGMADSFGEDCHQDISKLWERFNERSHEIKNVKSGYALGLCLASHPDVPIKEGDSIVYSACLPVTKIEDIPKAMISYKIPPAKYAVFTHSGPISTIQNTVKYIWGTWVPKHSDIHKKDAPDFELYDERFNVDTLDGEVDIYVAVK